METIEKEINGNTFFLQINDVLITQVDMLFDAIRSIPSSEIRDGFKIEIGFSVFILSEVMNGYKILVPDYLGNPFCNTTEDLTIAVGILFRQSMLLKISGIEGVATRFDDEIIVAKGALDGVALSMQRYADLGEKTSGWCIERLKRSDDGTFKTVNSEEYQSIYAYQLLRKCPELIKTLVLPYDYVIVYFENEIVEILNEYDKSILKGE